MEFFNLYEYKTGYEALDPFLNKHIEDEEDLILIKKKRTYIK